MKFVAKTPLGPQLSIVVGPTPYARSAAHAEASSLLADFPGATLWRVDDDGREHLLATQPVPYEPRVREVA